MNKKSINAALDMAFQARHWQRMRLCSMPPAFARDLDVSPSFLAQPLRHRGTYSISGYLSLVCQPFEREYLSEHGTPKASGRAWNPIWLGLHIANLDGVREHAYLESEVEIPDFCDCITRYLERMPHTMSDLKAAIKSQEILGRPLKGWVFVRPEKLAALTSYMDRLPQ